MATITITIRIDTPDNASVTVAAGEAAQGSSCPTAIGGTPAAPAALTPPSKSPEPPKPGDVEKEQYQALRRAFMSATKRDKDKAFAIIGVQKVADVKPADYVKFTQELDAIPEPA